jgi:hypothetical protein
MGKPNRNCWRLPQGKEKALDLKARSGRTFWNMSMQMARFQLMISIGLRAQQEEVWSFRSVTVLQFLSLKKRL